MTNIIRCFPARTKHPSNGCFSQEKGSFQESRCAPIAFSHFVRRARSGIRARIENNFIHSLTEITRTNRMERPNQRDITQQSMPSLYI